ncbi:hypothetical protein L6164_022806 [Bauhinia variegata]|uniref:Uncharacterized protein n=1 Tax=Bauhinia variegata TaxID=167791 RepID=A0ACB9MI74_BAUVA|nr:hypothetical protein L6164_022806 [Bauhinia variegata]
MTWLDFSRTVSQKETMGGLVLISAPFMKSSCKSFKQISKCSSPAADMTYSPVSFIAQTTIGSDFAKPLRPSTSLERSDATLGSTATLTTGGTENFIALIVCASTSFSFVKVAFLVMH